MTDFLYSPPGILACALVIVGFGWLAWRYRDADWLVIPLLCAVTMLGGSGWAQRQLHRRRR